MKALEVQKKYKESPHFNLQSKEKMTNEAEALEKVTNGLVFCSKKVKEDIAVLWNNIRFAYKFKEFIKQKF